MMNEVDGMKPEDYSKDWVMHLCVKIVLYLLVLKRMYGEAESRGITGNH